MTLFTSHKNKRKAIAESKILLAGPIRNVAHTIQNEVETLVKSLGNFKEIHCFVVESDSSDNTAKKLEELQSVIKNFSFVSVGNLSNNYPRRTDRIALCRNIIIDAVALNPQFVDIDYIAMADLDGMNALVTPEKVEQCWEVDEPWDVITANQLGEYYDIWGLSHPYWNPMDCWEQKRQLENILGNDMAQNIAVGCKQTPIDPRADLIEVDSAFGGLGIYKREAFLAGRYAGTDDQAGGIDVADHIPFHRDLRSKGYRIFINPALINCDKTPGGAVEEIVLPKPRGALKLVRNFGIMLFGKNRFNKYLEILQTP
ncbi:hypothetical protein [Polynucleobacter sp. MWH-UH2A]|uniref:hypothetical protein n=1 Tax=Polynucleobacter sp. MWH-UH2A TaxID=1855617 RepID=UPI001BFD961D|nr:hypothetical protein [Polynucleobacter sp. MWH-UH2A]QWD64303.1 hypothetical protein IC571_01340 [Polynucleobacter sp. MWH-UH2A]